MIATIVMTWACGILIDSQHNPKVRSWMLGVGISINLLLLAYFKYAGFIAENWVNTLNFLGVSIQVHPLFTNVHLPIGISFFIFQAISYLIDLYRKEIGCQKNVLRLALYKSFFPQLIAGPIVRYSDIENEIEKRPLKWSLFSEGTYRFCIGLAQKVLIANPMGQLADEIFNAPLHELTPLTCWIGAIAYSLQIFFDFAGYSNMAIGLGRIFGFTFPENFNLPYTARSVTDFWRRWHMSLSTWFRDYLYIPLGGNRCSKLRNYMNLFVVFLLCGFWHGASWTFIIWGGFHGLFLCIEKAGLLKTLERSPAFLARTYTLLAVLIGWVFFRSETLTHAFQFLSKMFLGVGEPLSPDYLTLYDLLSYERMLVLVVGIALALDLLPRFSRTPGVLLQYKPYLEFSKGLGFSCIFLVCLIYLAGGTFNPFIYFRF
jgi:alginate O-acetyltransferase complex protein AlgI